MLIYAVRVLTRTKLFTSLTATRVSRKVGRFSRVRLRYGVLRKSQKRKRRRYVCERSGRSFRSQLYPRDIFVAVFGSSFHFVRSSF